MKLFKTIHDKSNFIHHTAIVEEGVIMGKNNYIGPFCIIKKGVGMEDNNRFEAYCSIGTNPEYKGLFHNTESKYSVDIGSNNVFREYVTINSGSSRHTKIYNNNIMLRGSHLGHDCILNNEITLSCNVLVGGHSEILDGVNMGLGSICHQFSILGGFSMIGMGGVVTKKSKILPGQIYVGNPVKHLKENTIGLTRANGYNTVWGMDDLIEEYEETINIHKNLK